MWRVNHYRKIGLINGVRASCARIWRVRFLFLLVFFDIFDIFLFLFLIRFLSSLSRFSKHREALADGCSPQARRVLTGVYLPMTSSSVLSVGCCAVVKRVDVSARRCGNEQ
jgi:hypothetical protein